MPAVRKLYFTASESGVYADARHYAERYRQEAERLNAFEAQNRAREEALDDAMLARVSSFLKSYGEMTRGEEFVMREVRSRARERTRWMIGAGLLMLALIVVPESLGLLRRAVRRNATGASA
jgi:zinc/manganese transport system permease protein